LHRLTRVTSQISLLIHQYSLLDLRHRHYYGLLPFDLQAVQARLKSL